MELGIVFAELAYMAEEVGVLGLMKSRLRLVLCWRLGVLDLGFGAVVAREMQYERGE